MLKSSRRKGQTATEYMLAVSFIVVALAAVFYQLLGTNNSKQNAPVYKAFQNAKDVVEAPYP